MIKGTSWFASGSTDKTIKIWNVSDGNLVHTIEGHTGIII